MRLRIWLPLAAVVLTACGGTDDAREAGDAPQPAGAFEPLTDTLDRAAGVEDTLREAEAERRRQLEAAE